MTENKERPHAEDLIFELAIRIRFYRGDESDEDLLMLKERIKSNFEKAKIVSSGSAEAKILSVKIK